MYQPLITFCPHPAIFTQVLCIFVRGKEKKRKEKKRKEKKGKKGKKHGKLGENKSTDR